MLQSSSDLNWKIEDVVLYIKNGVGLLENLRSKSSIYTGFYWPRKKSLKHKLLNCIWHFNVYRSIYP